MTQRYALGVQYDGRNWQGWQSQPDGQTIQDVLEGALSKFADAPIQVVCAGRTDAGVHALGQVVHFESAATRLLTGWVRGTNSLLPDSISVSWAREVESDFHARFSATARTYYYVLYNHPIRSPHAAGRAGWFHQKLDIGAMQTAAHTLVGEHDFSAFRSSQCQAKTPVKTLHRAEVTACGEHILMTFTANAFLHHMIRNIVGCLVTVGKGAEAPSWLNAVREAGDRSLAAPTFMADGLYLGEISYAQKLPGAVPLDTVFPGITQMLEMRA